MVGKSWLYVALTVAVLLCGCNGKMKESKWERKIVNSENIVVKLETSKGDILIELNSKAAPITVKNFLTYVDEGFYNKTIFHRVIPGFMIQGGGFTADMERKKTHDPIANEAKNGLSNARGTIAMARTNDPDSATAQFFINHADNTPLDYGGVSGAGYAVFGKTIEGIDVVDAIAAVRTTARNGMDDVPAEPVVINSVSIVE